MGDTVSGTRNGRAHIRTVGRDVWGRRTRAAFLEHLAATGNVLRSAQLVGRTAKGAHSLRQRDGDFATAWTAALDAACDRLHAGLIARAMDGLGGGLGGDLGGDSGDEVDRKAGDSKAGECAACGATGGQAFDPELAMKVLSHRATIAGKPARLAPRGHYRRVPIAEVEASLAKKIAAILKARIGR